jgi:hypothetical protein
MKEARIKMIKEIIIQFDDNDIDGFMAVEAIKQFEIPWITDIFLGE